MASSRGSASWPASTVRTAFAMWAFTTRCTAQGGSSTVRPSGSATSRSSWHETNPLTSGTSWSVKLIVTVRAAEPPRKCERAPPVPRRPHRSARNCAASATHKAMRRPSSITPIRQYGEPWALSSPLLCPLSRIIGGFGTFGPSGTSNAWENLTDQRCVLKGRTWRAPPLRI